MQHCTFICVINHIQLIWFQYQMCSAGGLNLLYSFVSCYVSLLQFTYRSVVAHDHLESYDVTIEIKTNSQLDTSIFCVVPRDIV